MSKIKMGVDSVRAVYRTIADKTPFITARVKALYSSGGKEKKKAISEALRAWPGRIPNANQVAQYVKANPLNSLLLLYTTAETADFAYELIAEDEDLGAAFVSLTPVDTVETAVLPEGEYEDMQTEALQAKAITRETLEDMSVSALRRFDDEINLLAELEQRVPGDTVKARRDFIDLLYRLSKLGPEVFMVRELLEGIGRG